MPHTESPRLRFPLLVRCSCCLASNGGEFEGGFLGASADRVLVVRLLSQDSTNDRFPKVCVLPVPSFFCKGDITLVFLARLLPGLTEKGRRGSLTVLCVCVMLCRPTSCAPSRP